MRLRATREVYYAGKTRRENEEFEVEPGDESSGKLLVALEKAVEVGSSRKATAKPAVGKPVEPAEPVVNVSEASPTPPEQDDVAPEQQKRRYVRRDMRAKDE